MAVQNVRTWQWVLAGLVIGVLVGLVWTTAGDEETVSNSWGITRFVRSLNYRDDAGNPILSNIVIDPLMADPNGKPVQRVHFTVRMKNVKTGKFEPVEQASIVADVPVLRGSDNKDYRVQDFLKEQQQNLTGLKYKYAWWKVSGLNGDQLKAGDREMFWWQKPSHAWITAIGGCALLVGVLWPMFVKGLISAGILPKPERAEIDLSTVKNVKSKSEPNKPRVTDADQKALDELNARLEEKVGGMLIRADERDDLIEQKKEEALIRQLSNVPLEQQGTQQSAEEKEYGGEYYPVARPHHHADDDKAKTKK